MILTPKVDIAIFFL